MVYTPIKSSMLLLIPENVTQLWQPHLRKRFDKRGLSFFGAIANLARGDKQGVSNTDLKQ